MCTLLITNYKFTVFTPLFWELHGWSDHLVKFQSVITDPVGCFGVSHTSNQQTAIFGQPAKRVNETESISGQKKHQLSSSNNFSQYDACKSGIILNPNHVSIGLKLSCEEDEHNSSVTCTSESNTATLPVTLSLGDDLKAEINLQKGDLDQYIRLQVIISCHNINACYHTHMSSILPLGPYTSCIVVCQLLLSYSTPYSFSVCVLLKFCFSSAKFTRNFCLPSDALCNTSNSCIIFHEGKSCFPFLILIEENDIIITPPPPPLFFYLNPNPIFYTKHLPSWIFCTRPTVLLMSTILHQ